MADSASKLNEQSARAERTLEEQLQKVVGSESFSQMLAETMGTSMGFVKLWKDGSELMLRSMRMPTQGELTRISNQIARLEDKLEDVLIAVERLEEQQAASERANGSKPAARRSQARRSAG
jgi:hypothetical protein